MKPLLTICTLTLGIVLNGCVTTPELSPTIMAATDATLDKKGTLALSGSGFVPQTDVVLLFTTEDGVESDISYALEPAPKADASGNWATTWSYGRFVSKKLVTEGDYNLVATDADFMPLATYKVTFTK